MGVGIPKKLQAYLALGLILLSAYFLTPSLFGFKEIRETAEKAGESPPWYVRLFPHSEINLGLDLRGGIYLELEVDLQEALRHRAALVASELERYFKEKQIGYRLLEVLPKTSTIAVWLDKPEQKKLLEDHLGDFYRNTIVELKASPLILFEIQDPTEEGQLAKFQEVRQWAQGQSSILDISRRQNSLEIILKPDASAEEVRQAAQGQFGTSLGYQDPQGIVFLGQSESYQEQLKDETLKQAVETIRNRIDRHGVAEPTIQRLGENRVVVELPGVKDPDRAIGLVKRAGKLEFKLVDESVSDAQVQTLVETARTENKIPSGFTEEVVVQINEALKGKIPADSEVAFEVQYDPVTKKITGGIPYLLKRRVDVSGEMLRNAQVSVQNNEPYVSLSFDSTGTKAFADLTANNIGKRLAIVLDGVVSKAPVIKSAIPSGEAQITLGYGDYQSILSEAEDLVVVLREGALPATLREATKTVIGPSLGKASIDRSFKSTLLAAAVVMVFMAVWYKRSGLLADLAVILNVVFIFAALAFFGATLTLPGVAGIVLTIGMAVDANVIILERIKEELAAGRTVKSAVDVGYSNAMRAVVDANLTTFLSGIILYQFGTGPVRGFAVTLMIGIMTTLYTAVVLTRMFYEFILSRRNVAKLSL